jgi:hypothetical protein
MAGKEPQPTSVGIKLQPPVQHPVSPSAQPKTIASIPKAPGTNKRPK